MLLLSIVGLSTESSTEDSLIIHFPFLLHMQQHILNSPIKTILCPPSQLGSIPLSMVPLNLGDQLLYFDIRESFVASKNFIIVVIIHIMLISENVHHIEDCVLAQLR